jgi:hypothetical protein
MRELICKSYIWYLLKYLFDGPEQVARVSNVCIFIGNILTWRMFPQIIASLCALSGLLREHLNVV